MPNNFRARFFSTLGFQDELKPALDDIFREKEVDIDVLKKYCLRYGFPSRYRSHAWMLLLGVAPACQDAARFVGEQRKAQFEDLCGLADVLFPLPPGVRSSAPEETLVRVYRAQQEAEAPQDDTNEVEDSPEDLLTVAQVFVAVFSDQVDAYWCYSTFLQAVRSLHVHQSASVFRQTNLLSRLLLSENERLFRHLQAHDVPVDSFGLLWFRTYFASSLSLPALELLWDRVVGVSSDFIVVFALALLLHTAPKLLRKDGAELQHYLTDLPDLPMHGVLARATEIWSGQSESEKR